MKTRSSRIAIALALAVLSGLPVFAADPVQVGSPTGGQATEGAFSAELEVTEVLLDVLVTDSRGNVILGLDRGDFVVEEAGETVNVNSSTFYSNRRYVDTADIAGRLGVEKTEVPVDRFFILFFHDQRALDHSLIRSEVDAVRRAKEWVTRELLPNDWVAVLSYDASLRLHQDFTTDNAAILRALDDVVKAREPKGIWASRTDEHEGPSLGVNLPHGKDLQKATTRVYSALTEVAQAAGYIIGRKNLMLFSVGFGEVGESGNYNQDSRYYNPMMQALNDNNVAVYTISWLENRSEENEGWAALSNVLSVLAEDTGGRYYFNFVDFKDPLSRVTEDNNGYYLLSYASEHPRGTEGYRKVAVRTVNPAFVVRARQGYSYGN
jgi:VWFA-related protein